jgi:mRNA-degrading endonuclease RelE of RelBE toxin-antitoxin system
LTKTAYDHLRAFRRFDRNRILDAIKEQLTFAPAGETRNKKLLRTNPVADWELRVDPYRVFYEVDMANQTVLVVGVGLKVRNRLLLDGSEITL